jgi:peroxiredoxin
MLAAGDRIPDATVWLAPREPVGLLELVDEGPVLLFFYLFDFSST